MNKTEKTHVSLGATTQIGATLAFATITVSTAYTLLISNNIMQKKVIKY